MKPISVMALHTPFLIPHQLPGRDWQHIGRLNWVGAVPRSTHSGTPRNRRRSGPSARSRTPHTSSFSFTHEPLRETPAPNRSSRAGPSLRFGLVAETWIGGRFVVARGVGSGKSQRHKRPTFWGNSPPNRHGLVPEHDESLRLVPNLLLKIVPVSCTRTSYVSEPRLWCSRTFTLPQTGKHPVSSKF